VLTTFSCRTINGEKRLMEEPGLLCEGPLYTHWYRIACFWTVFYVLGIPILNSVLLCMYRIPNMSRGLAKTALFRAAVEHALLRGIDLPSVNSTEILLSQASDELIDKLHASLALEEAEDSSGDDVGPPEPDTPAKLVETDAPRLKNLSDLLKKKKIDRKDKVFFILGYTSHHCTPKRMTWMELPKGSEEEAKLREAKQAIGSLFAEFYSCVIVISRVSVR